jgi:hypothetical protein
MQRVEACLSDRRGKVPGTKPEKEMGRCEISEARYTLTHLLYILYT